MAGVERPERTQYERLFRAVLYYRMAAELLLEEGNLDPRPGGLAELLSGAPQSRSPVVKMKG